jgi:hypothetical protein
MHYAVREKHGQTQTKYTAHECYKTAVTLNVKTYKTQDPFRNFLQTKNDLNNLKPVSVMRISMK